MSDASDAAVLQEAEEQGSGITYDQLLRIATKMGLERREWAGLPIPIDGHRLIIEPKYPYLALGEIGSDEEPKDTGAMAEEVPDDFQIVNVWRSRRSRAAIVVAHEGPAGCRRAKVYKLFEPDTNKRLKMLLRTGTACAAWSIRAESMAIARLAGLVTDHQLKTWLLTGCLVETSKRSGVSYLFRRCRPTIALAPSRKGARSGPGDEEEMCRVLCALCLHPIAYYDGTWAGSMVPTDEMIAHLMLMRGDEHMFWRRANQHSIDAPEAGV